MANHEQHNGPADTAGPVPPVLTSKGAGRRRLAGLGASGVLMTLASSNAMAGLVCKSPSGALSGNLSSQQPQSVTCQGRSPGFWKNHQASWPAEVSTTSLFSSLFPCGGELAKVTCLEILSKQAADKSNVGMHIMATYLNVATNRIGFLSRNAVIAMWNEYSTTGEYVPTPGATPWSGGQLVDYLASTMG